MKQKWLLTGTALLLAAALAGCGNTPAADQTAKISMEQAQTAALDAANIEAVDADISSATLSEVAGVICRDLLQGGVHLWRSCLLLLHQRRERRGAGGELPG